MKAVVAAFNQEKAQVGAFSVIVQPVVEPMEHYKNYSQEHSPRDSHSTSPPSLQLPTHQSHGSSKDVSPVESPHSHSPPGPPIPTHPHQLHLQVDNNVMDEKPRQIFLLYFPYLSIYL